MTKALNFVKILNVVPECPRMSTNVHGEMWYYYTDENEKCPPRIPEGHSKGSRRAVGGQLQGTVKSDKVYTGNEKKLDQF